VTKICADRLDAELLYQSCTAIPMLVPVRVSSHPGSSCCARNSRWGPSSLIRAYRTAAHTPREPPWSTTSPSASWWQRCWPSLSAQSLRWVVALVVPAAPMSLLSAQATKLYSCRVILTTPCCCRCAPASRDPAPSSTPMVVFQWYDFTVSFGHREHPVGTVDYFMRIS
jgi:hypothetical protein